jgi:hypothetical protein
MQRINSHNRREDRVRPGTAMLETILVIPLLAVVIAGVFFFGMVMRNQQRLRTANRYIAWEGLQDDSMLDEEFFGGRSAPESISIHAGSGQSETLNDLVDAADDLSDGAGDLAERALLSGQEGQFPHGWARRVGAQFPQEVAALQRIQGELDDSDKGSTSAMISREGQPWQRNQASFARSVLDLYLSDFDDTVEDRVGPQVGGAMQQLYLRGW